MKATNFLFVAILGVGLAMSSCNNEVIVGDENNPGDGDGYMSLTLQFPEQGVSTYAEEAGAGDEVKVSTVTVVFFDAGAVSDIVDLSAATTGDFAISGTKVKTKAMKISKKDYDVVVLVNKPSNLSITVGDTKSNFETVAAVNLANLTSSSGFFMTNASSYKKVYASNFQTTETGATDIPVPLKVERAVAKVIVSANTGGITVPSGASISNTSITWAVDIKNKEMYWMRKLTKKLELSGSDWIAGAMETEADYTSSGREFLYAEDPNFASHASSEDGKFDKIASGATILNALDAVEYAPENTMQAIDQFRNVSTSVVIKLVYVPSGITDPTTNGYFIYNGTPIEYSTMVGYIATPATIPATYPGLAELLAAESITAPPSASAEYKNDGNTLTFYFKGVSYFNVPIKHFKNQTELMAYGRYGVVRNNVYKLTINSIKGPGYIAPDRQYWEDDEESYISVEFEIMPWYVRDQGIDL